MPDFSYKSKFNKEANFVSIRFGADAPLLETELNEMQDIQRHRLKSALKAIVQDGLLAGGSLTYDGSKFIIENTDAIIDGEVYHISHLEITVSDGEDVYLKVWEKDISYQSTIKKYGNEQEVTIPNEIFDERVNQETSRRVALVYDLTKVKDGNGKFLKLGRISGGSFIKEVQEIANLTELADISQLGSLKDDLDEHKAEITTEEGRHGLRYWNDKLEFFDGSDWIEIKTGGGGVPPSNVINPSIIVGNSQLTIKWDDPEDTVVDGQTISTWAGTKLVRKAGSYPTNEKDGIVLVDNKVRGAYFSTGFVDSGLTNGVTYYYQLFPYSDQGAVNRNEANRLSGTPQPYKIYGVAIDLTNSNPETAVTYTDDAVGMTGGSSAWDSMAIFKDIKPCVLKNGVVQYYLDPNDFTKKVDGTPADIESGNDGDVMIEIPKTGFLISTVGNILTVKVTDNPNNPNFKYYAHTRVTEGDRDKLYIGAYLGWKDGSNKLRSLSGKTPTASQTIGTFRTQAKANGSGYDLVSFYPLTLLQCLYLIRYKNLDSQTALGRGYVDGNSAATNTGGTNAKGMFFGETTGKQQMKFLGIEDFWGNLRWWIDGLYSDANRNIMTAFKDFNDTGSGYTNRGQGATSDIYGYMSKPQGFTEAGFVLKENNGSETTYFCDYAYLSTSRLPYFGGNWNFGSRAGAFYLSVYHDASYSDSHLGGRLMYL